MPIRNFHPLRTFARSSEYVPMLLSSAVVEA
jgi:hypothetical protein